MVSASQTVRVELASEVDRSYAIQIGQGLLTNAVERCAAAADLQQALVITDDHVGPLYGQPIHEQFRVAGIPAHLISVAPGERSKSIETAQRIWEQALDVGTTRRSTVIAVGGGVVGDLAGFVAASFARGLDLIQIPTSLLAQVDSSVGGKVAINLAEAKNMVGFFWQPKLVLADLDALDTLPDRDFVAGLAEVVKYGVIADKVLFERLESDCDSILDKDKSTLLDVVSRCCQIKAEIVGQDEREESGRRALLNYGHTIGHALEAICGYGELLHGEAIAIGMHSAAWIAANRGMVPVEFVGRQKAMLTAMRLATGPPDVDETALWDTITKDKKANAAGVRFILPTQLGEVQAVDGITRPEVLEAISSSCND